MCIRDSVLLEGKKIDSYSPLERALRIQPVFQDPYSTLNPNHTIGFIVRRPLLLNTSLPYDEIETKVAKTLDLVGLSKNFINRFPSQLSGGQRQRVAIARAIILEPKILICDEPTSSLDVTIQSQILDLLNELKERLKITIVLISHNISVVKFLSDRVLVMNNGEILESGNTLNIINKPKNNYTQKLMSAIFTVKKKVTSLADMKGLRVFGVPTAGKFLSRYGLIPVIVPWDDVETAMQTGELDGVCWCGFTEAYEVGWADICKYALTNSVTGAWFGSYFANQKSWDKLSPKLQALYRMSINDSHYYRQVWYWGGEADLRVNGKKMELTSLPANEWSQVVKDSEQFWDETSKISPRAKKVVDAFKLYAATMEKAGYPYR